MLQRSIQYRVMPFYRWMQHGLNSFWGHVHSIHDINTHKQNFSMYSDTCFKEWKTVFQFSIKLKHLLERSEKIDVRDLISRLTTESGLRSTYLHADQRSFKELLYLWLVTLSCLHGWPVFLSELCLPVVFKGTSIGKTLTNKAKDSGFSSQPGKFFR